MSWTPDPPPEAPLPEDGPLPSAPLQPPPPRRHTPDRMRWHGLEVLKDNIEAFTIALVMALVIKHFCVEAFKIPTGSMVPTLIGESAGGTGDRILVDKWAYLFSGPDRWDVVVFRYPLNKSKHFIKRVAGVGGEWIKIVAGDIWTRPSDEAAWRIATKPPRARDELYLPVFPPPPPRLDEAGRPIPSTLGPEDYWDTDGGWSVLTYDQLRYAGGEANTVTFAKRIGDHTHPDSSRLRSDGTLVRDVRVRMQVLVEDATPTTFTLRWQCDDDHANVVRLSSEAGQSLVSSRRTEFEASRPIDVRLAAGRAAELLVESVDGEWILHLDGREVARLDEERQMDEVRPLRDFTQLLTLEAEGSPAAISNIRVERDLFYISDRPLRRDDHGLKVPEDHYFMLGDNTGNSSDSRRWQLICLPMQDGSEICYESSDDDNKPHRDDDGYNRVIDREGVERRWLDEDRDPDAGRQYRDQPFVHRELVVGRAFLIFWPLFPDFPNRAGFIH